MNKKYNEEHFISAIQSSVIKIKKITFEVINFCTFFLTFL